MSNVTSDKTNPGNVEDINLIRMVQEYAPAQIELVENKIKEYEAKVSELKNKRERLIALSSSVDALEDDSYSFGGRSDGS